MGMDAGGLAGVASAASQQGGGQGGAGGGNDLFARLMPMIQQRMQQQGQAGGQQPPKRSAMQALNVTRGETGGNVGGQWTPNLTGQREPDFMSNPGATPGAPTEIQGRQVNPDGTITGRGGNTQQLGEAAKQRIATGVLRGDAQAGDAMNPMPPEMGGVAPAGNAVTALMDKMRNAQPMGGGGGESQLQEWFRQNPGARGTPWAGRGGAAGEVSDAAIAASQPVDPAQNPIGAAVQKMAPQIMTAMKGAQPKKSATAVIQARRPDSVRSEQDPRLQRRVPKKATAGTPMPPTEVLPEGPARRPAAGGGRQGGRINYR
jgi:hypothetical protein